MPCQSAANRGRPFNRCSVGASWLGLTECKAGGGDDDLDELGVSACQRVTAELVSNNTHQLGAARARDE